MTSRIVKHAKFADDKVEREAEEEARKRERLRSMAAFFERDPSYLITLDYNRMTVLKEVRKSHRTAKYYCGLCNYHCDNLDVVDRHISDKRHVSRLREAEEAETVDLIDLETLWEPTLGRSVEGALSSLLRAKSLPRAELEERREEAKKLDLELRADSPESGLRLQLHGSSLHGMALRGSDLNLNLTREGSEEEGGRETLGAEDLRTVADFLRRNPRVKEVRLDLSLRRPNVRFKLAVRGTECVLRVKGERAVLTGRLLKAYAERDPRANELGKLMRLWTATCELDREEKGTRPGYAAFLMVVYFLQEEGVLPVLQLGEGGDAVVVQVVRGEEGKGDSRNSDSIALLWLKLLKFYGFEFDRSRDAVDVRKRGGEAEGKDREREGGGGFIVVDPYRGEIRTRSHRSTEAYTVHCFGATLLYSLIPRTRDGPALGAVRREPEIEDFGSARIRSFLREQRALWGKVVSYVTLVDVYYRSPIRDRRVAVSLTREIRYGTVVNPTAFKVRALPEFTGRKWRPPAGTYERFAVYRNDSDILYELIDPDALVYDLENKTNLTGGRVLKVYCKECDSEGHLWKECPLLCLDREPVPTPEESLEPRDLALLDELLRWVESSSSPSEREIALREGVRAEVEAAIREVRPGTSLRLFGSSRNGFGQKGSDLDLCLTLDDDPEGDSIDAPRFVRELFEELRPVPGLKLLEAVVHAKVPIVKFRHEESGLEGDISLYNLVALRNTRLLWTYSEIDDRTRPLVYAFKRLVKLCGIGDASKGGLSSYSYTLMVIYFLQRTSPPVLPVLQELGPEPRPSVKVGRFETYFFRDLERLRREWPGPSGSVNPSSPAELWLSLLKFYASEFDFGETIVSVKSSRAVKKMDVLCESTCITIEDPFEARNLGSGLSRRMNNHVVRVIRNAYVHFSTPARGLGPDPDIRLLEKHYFDPALLAPDEAPYDRQCYHCRSIGHRSSRCPEKKSSG